MLQKFLFFAHAPLVLRRHFAIAAHRAPGAKHSGTRHINFEQRTPPLLHASFFSYRPLPQDGLADLRARLLLELGQLGILGRIYLASEGVNAAMSVPAAALIGAQAVVSDHFPGCVIGTYGQHDDSGTSAPFWNLHVKVRNVLVRDGLPAGTIDVFGGTKGREVEPQEWHALVSKQDDSSVIVDCRNKYESEVGVFRGAKRILSHSYDETWSLLPPLLPSPESSKSILIYCTGGIRCVKASACSRLVFLPCFSNHLQVGAYLTQRHHYPPDKVPSNSAICLPCLQRTFVCRFCLSKEA